MTIRRVAIIYNGCDRPETTGVYVRRALGQFVELEHIQPNEWQRLPPDPFDFYLQVDDGHDVVLPPTFRPSAFWAIDTHMDFNRYLRVAKQYDLIFTAQRDGAEALNRVGIQATWLPLACDPFFHRKHVINKMHDLCFIGNMIDGPRADLVHFLMQQFPSMLVDRRYFEEMAKAYSASKVVFNRSIKNDINMRVFEAIACGSLLMTNELKANGLDELFKDGTHLATYQSPEELLDKIDFYLKNDQARETIAAIGMAHAHQAHTYSHRVIRILEAAEAIKSKVQSSVSSKPSGGTNYATDPFYYGYVRQEILDLVPNKAQRVLDIGCGAGRLGEALKHRQAATVVGVETIPAAATQARERLDRLYEEDIELLDTLGQEPPFDAIVCADVLEHLNNPLEVLRKARNWLKPDGTLIVSLPNARHHTVVRGLLEGHWMYEPAGLLDETHLRFFTRREIEKLLFRAGFTIRQRQITPGAGYDNWIRQGRPGEIKLGRLYVGGLSSEDAEEFHVYQYLFTASPSQRLQYGKTSIIIVTHNDLANTRDCVSGLLQLTDGPYELIFVDNGSTDGTPDYLNSLANARVICNLENRGFTAAINQGLEMATGEQFVLLDNNTYVTTGWLSRLLDALYAQENIGLVGPMSNCAPVQQCLRDIPYTGDYIGLDGFAWDIAKEHVHQRLETSVLGSFCLLLRKEVFTQLGMLLDEGSSTEKIEEYCLRAASKGWKAVVARDVFIHHTTKKHHVSELNSWGLTSIIIPVHGQLEHTKKCIDSIRHCTTVPYELILIDNASSDDTLPWLQTQPDLTVVTNSSNRGFPVAVNQGLRMAQGNQLLVLNNDTVVTPGWLEWLLEALHAESTVGLVGPCTNKISGEQQVAVDYDQETLTGLDAFASNWQLAHRQQYFTTDRLVGFCMLIKRSVIDRIGSFDEQFGIGNFEDDDYCRRAIQAGFKLLIASNCFIHHVGHATFRGAGIDFHNLMQQNQALFNKKWGLLGHSVTHTPILPHMEYELADTGDSGNLLLTRKHIRLSLCMIVRNNSKFIVECLKSIRPYVDEMIIVDTGSTDSTAELAKSLGARVYHFPWCDSFSAARNESLKYARGEWIFWMDSDDVISTECGQKLRQLAYSQHPPERMGFFMQVHCLGTGPERQHDIMAVDHVKLFRNHPQIRFEFRMHEQIIQSIRRQGGEIEWTDIFVTHSNYDNTPDGQKHKLERDIKLLHLDDSENPNHTFILFNLGMTYEGHDASKALGYLERSIALASPGETHLRKAFAYLTRCYEKTNQPQLALAAIDRGLEQFPLDPELRFRRAMLFTDLGRLDDAVAAYCDLLDNKPDRHITSVAQGIDSYLARHNLATVLSEQNRLQEAHQEFHAVTQEYPWFRHGWRGLISNMLKQGRVQASANVIQSSTSLRSLPGEGEYLLGLVYLETKDIHQAAEFFHQATSLNPSDATILEKMAFVTFTNATSYSPLPILQRQIELDSKNASAYHNLGSLYFDMKEHNLAVDCLQKSLEIRPNARQTLSMLAAVYRDMGNDLAAENIQKQAEIA